MRRWNLQDGRLPSQASPAGKRPVLIFKETALTAVVSLAVLAVPVASEGLRTLRHHVRRYQHLQNQALQTQGDEKAGVHCLLVLPGRGSHHPPG